MAIRFGFVGLDHWYNAFPTLEGLRQNPDRGGGGAAHRDPARAGEAKSGRTRRHRWG